MSSTGSPIVDDLVDKFTFKKQRQAVSDAVDNATKKVKNVISGNHGDQPIATYTYDKPADKPTSQPAPKATPAKKMPSYETGTHRVPKTGPALLHKDEAVLPKHEAEHYRSMKGAHEALGGKEDKPKKEIKHIVTKKAKSGGYIHEHHHTHPEHHPMEEHVSPDQDAMMQHMMQHMGGDSGEAPASTDASQVASAGAPAASAMGM